MLAKVASMEVQVEVGHGMKTALLTQMEQLVKEIEVVKVIDVVMEAPSAGAAQVLLVEMQEVYTWEVMEVMVFNPR